MRFSHAVAAVLSALTLAACGSDDDASTTAGGAGTTAGTTASADAPGPFPVTITHTFGTTTVKAAPERVATAGFNEQDFALALGVKPVAVREFIGDFPFKTRPWAPGADSDPTPQYIGSTDIDIEKLAAARPDVILGIYSFIDKGMYGKLSGIAPTIAQTKDFGEGAVPWDRQLLDTGKALGRETRAKEVVADVDRQFDDAKKAHPEFAGRKLTVAFESGGTLFNLGDDDLRQQFFTDLGFVTPKVNGKDYQEDNISRERLDVLDQDVLVLISDDEKGILDDPLYQRLKAVKEGRVINVKATDAFAGALGYNSPLSRPYLLKQVVPQLVAAVDGDPATKVPPAQ
ncbi:iron-siderophore ABC transporter substrate-binding protein [Patulibacter minatonensis]|uniref:iron-siderophore ABC transporter substrate-binding protein n=1 Tax=Patulibacter minatonensis TaxID=298163 RepID=UPI00047EE1DC|nr:iron-siderophore ABC transporter substrate-binding protein [Patulibacter minatonensis]